MTLVVALVLLILLLGGGSIVSWHDPRIDSHVPGAICFVLMLFLVIWLFFLLAGGWPPVMAS